MIAWWWLPIVALVAFVVGVFVDRATLEPRVREVERLVNARLDAATGRLGRLP